MYLGSSQMALIKSFMSMRTLSLRQTQLLALWAIGSQLGSAKLTASAMLKPALKPEWYAAARETMNSLGLNKILWINQRCFVSDKLGAVAELIFVVLLRISFKLLIGGRIHCVPKLRLSLVQIINRVQIHVLLVPAEHGFPSAYVDVGWSHTIKPGSWQTITKLD